MKWIKLEDTYHNLEHVNKVTITEGEDPDYVRVDIDKETYQHGYSTLGPFSRSRILCALHELFVQFAQSEECEIFDVTDVIFELIEEEIALIDEEDELTEARNE